MKCIIIWYSKLILVEDQHCPFQLAWTQWQSTEINQVRCLNALESPNHWITFKVIFKPILPRQSALCGWSTLVIVHPFPVRASWGLGQHLTDEKTEVEQPVVSHTVNECYARIGLFLCDYTFPQISSSYTLTAAKHFFTLVKTLKIYFVSFTIFYHANSPWPAHAFLNHWIFVFLMFCY